MVLLCHSSECGRFQGFLACLASGALALLHLFGCNTKECRNSTKLWYGRKCKAYLFVQSKNGRPFLTSSTLPPPLVIFISKSSHDLHACAAR